jgi:hypothetical protein
VGRGHYRTDFQRRKYKRYKKHRGIALINILSKIYSQILLNRLNYWSETFKKTLPNQFGFQKVKSTEDCIFILHSIIAKSLKYKKIVYVTFLHLQKAYDNLERTFMLQKLIIENISTITTKSIIITKK